MLFSITSDFLPSPNWLSVIDQVKKLGWVIDDYGTNWVCFCSIIGWKGWVSKILFPSLFTCVDWKVISINTKPKRTCHLCVNPIQLLLFFLHLKIFIVVFLSFDSWKLRRWPCHTFGLCILKASHIFINNFIITHMISFVHYVTIRSIIVVIIIHLHLMGGWYFGTLSPCPKDHHQLFFYH